MHHDADAAPFEIRLEGLRHADEDHLGPQHFGRARSRSRDLRHGDQQASQPVDLVGQPAGVGTCAGYTDEVLLETLHERAHRGERVAQLVNEQREHVLQGRLGLLGTDDTDGAGGQMERVDGQDILHVVEGETRRPLLLQLGERISPNHLVCALAHQLGAATVAGEAAGLIYREDAPVVIHHKVGGVVPEGHRRRCLHQSWILEERPWTGDVHGWATALEARARALARGVNGSGSYYAVRGLASIFSQFAPRGVGQWEWLA